LAIANAVPPAPSLPAGALVIAEAGTARIQRALCGSCPSP